MLELLDPTAIQNRALFEGIQGNILKAHGRHHTANLFIQCRQGEQASAIDWLKSLVEGEDPLIKSGYAHLRSNILWTERKLDSGLFASIYVSAAGYDYLFGNNSSQRFADAPFRNGMKNADLNDPAASDWEPGFQDDIHFMLLLGHIDTIALTAAVNSVAATIPAFANITTIERGDALFNKEGAGIEHFGYVDGVSQPLFFTDEWDEYRQTNDIHTDADVLFDPRAPASLVLEQDPFFPDDPAALGSYFVFRKLEQNVQGFKQAENDLAEELALRGEDRERAGAMIVGRFEDGTPVELSDEAGLIHSDLLNNFDYDLADASRCPFHGHIRKSNPRSGMPAGSGGMEEAKQHIMARRGIPFGTRTDDPNDGQLFNKPRGGVGLLFMSYQTSIENQFEFIQKSWVNDPRFPHFNPADPDGLDPVIGQGDRAEVGSFATAWGNPATMQRARFEQFVHLNGGEYFFTPSMKFLKTIDTL